MRKRLFMLLGVLVLAGSFAGGWLWMDYNSFTERPLELPEQGGSFEVKPGSSMYAVARELESRGYIDNSRYFRWMTRLSGDAHRIKAGEYLLEPGLTPPKLLEQLIEGKVRQYAITLVEGWNFREMMAEVNANEALRHELKGLSAEAIMERLGFAGEHPEGRFLPETYHFPRGLSDVAFLQRAHKALRERLEEEWAKRDEGLPFKSPYDALILASIVEKETGVESERPAIAGVFIRRLQKGMRLQTDPTVIYGLGPDFDGNIRRRDLLNDTPYNSYTRGGLPPTPIAMPGAEAIHAVMHPDDSDNLYFVAKGDGSHYFSSTLEEHNRAVRKYQIENRRRDYSSSPSGE